MEDMLPNISSLLKGRDKLHLFSSLAMLGSMSFTTQHLPWECGFSNCC